MSLLEKLHAAGVLSILDAQFAQSLGRISKESDENVLLGAALCCHLAQRGHLCLDLTQPELHLAIDENGDEISFGYVEGWAWPSSESWAKCLSNSLAVSDGESFTPLVLQGDGQLYLHRMWDYQRRLASQVKKRIGHERDDFDASALDEALSRIFPDDDATNSSQRVAARNATERGLSVIVGGPGTGKTTLVVKIVTLLIEQALASGRPAPRILLCAPTGKAAQRMSESVRRAGSTYGSELGDAMTIHRVLMSQRRETGTLSGTLPFDVVIVDESSMVDVALMTQLVEAISDDARLVLLGDRHQLASVEAGAVLADICKGSENGVTELLKSYRFAQDSGIGTLAGAIKSADHERSLAVLKSEEFPDVSFSPIRDAAELSRTIARFAEQHFEQIYAFDDPAPMLLQLEQFRILTAKRKGPIGADGINIQVAAFLKSKNIITGSRWYRGRPVLLTSNDYEQELFNGDVGIAAYRDDGSLRVYFERASKDGGHCLVDVSPALLPPSETAYAMTIHKSQGSEFDHVLVVLPEEESPLLTRELLYTAVTRARKSVHIVGTEEAIAKAIENPTVRLSGLAGLLASEYKN